VRECCDVASAKSHGGIMRRFWGVRRHFGLGEVRCETHCSGAGREQAVLWDTARTPPGLLLY